VSWCRSSSEGDERTPISPHPREGFPSERTVVMSVHAGDVISIAKPFHLVGHYDCRPTECRASMFTDRFWRGDTFLLALRRRARPEEGSNRDRHVVGEIGVEGRGTWPPPSRTLVRGVLTR